MAQPERDQADHGATGGRPPPRGGLLIWLVVLGGLGAVLWVLNRLFPGPSGADWAWIFYCTILVGFLASGILAAERTQWGQHARYAGAWLMIILVLALGYTYRDEFTGVFRRIGTELSPTSPMAVGRGEMVVTAGEDGHFRVTGQANGRPVQFMIDTGATETVLSPADARRLGVPVDGLKFDQVAETANGLGYGAIYTLDTLSVGAIRFRNVPVLINGTPMSASLLGMSFLRRLDGFAIEGRQLRMKGAAQD